MERWITILVYFVLIVAILLAGLAEKTDLRCPTGGSKCGTGRGCAYYHGRAEDSEDTEHIVAKTRIAARYDQNSVKWRRCLIVSGLIALLIIPLLYSRFGDGREIIIILLVSYLLIYGMLQFFQDNLSKHAAETIDRNLIILTKRNGRKGGLYSDDYSWSV